MLLYSAVWPCMNERVDRRGESRHAFNTEKDFTARKNRNDGHENSEQEAQEIGK